MKTIKKVKKKKKGLMIKVKIFMDAIQKSIQFLNGIDIRIK